MASTLWDQAFELLGSDLKASLTSTRTRKRDVLEAVLKEITTKRDVAARKRWKFKKSNGDVIIVRDVLEKTAKWVHRFKETGDLISQYDTAHLSLPWAAFRFLLQVSVSEVEVFGAMISDCKYRPRANFDESYTRIPNSVELALTQGTVEVIARIVARYGEFERIHLLEQKSELYLMLEEALTRLYAEILTHLARAVRFFGEKTMARLLKSPFRRTDNEQMQKIRSHEADVLQIAQLADSNKLVRLEDAITRLSLQTNATPELLTDQKYSKVLEWLSTLPYYNHHQYISRSRLPGLGEWLFKHTGYKDWQASSSSSILVVHGITGSGKTVLCSAVIDTMSTFTDAHSDIAPYGYFYCANPEFESASHSSDDIMRCLLAQLVLDRTGRYQMRDFICSEYDNQAAIAKVHGQDLPKLITRDCVRLILDLAGQDPLTIIIDAIDTIPENEKHSLCSALEQIVSEADNVVKILLTCRSNDIVVNNLTANEQIQVTSHETRQDMETYVYNLIDTALASKSLLQGTITSSLRRTMMRTLIDGAVERFCRENTEDDIAAALQSRLPEDLDRLYQESLDLIFKTGKIARDTAVTSFRWILYMKEPLTPTALLAAISSDQDSTLRLTQLITICANLITLDEGCNVIRFAHQSVKEFLQRHEIFAPDVAHSCLALTCMEACSRGPLSIELEYPSDDFYVYAAMYWAIHSNMAMNLGLDKGIVDKMHSFIFDEDFDTTLSFELWLGKSQQLVKILPSDHSVKPSLDSIPDDKSGPLFLTSVFGLVNLLTVVLKRETDVDVNQRNKLGQTPVYLAAALGHVATVSKLAKEGANIHIEGGRYGSPLHAACFYGHLEVVHTLLQLNTNLSCGSVFGDALQAAFQGAHEDIALHLIEYSDIARSEEGCERALEGAARAGLFNVVQRLQQPPFRFLGSNEPDAMEKKTKKAIQSGQLGVLRQFIGQASREVLPPDAIAIATLYNHKTLVEFLVDEGTDLEVEGRFGTPLRTACLLNYSSIAHLLLDRGANIDACGIHGDAIQAAAVKGHSMMLRILIDKGADLNQQSGFYGTALQAAAYNGHYNAVELLLDAGSRVHQEGYSKDAFHAAAAGGHEKIIMLMLRKGYRFHTKPPDRMYYRIRDRGFKSLIQLASPGRKANPKTPDRLSPMDVSRSTEAPRPNVELEAIFTAAEDGRLTTQPNVEVLVSKYSPPTDLENYPLEVAASAGHKATVKLLLEQKELLGTPEIDISYAVNAAATNSHWTVVELLLKSATSRQSVKVCIEGIINIAKEREEQQIIHRALALASKYCSAEETRELLGVAFTPAEQSQHNSVVENDTLVAEFHANCKIGDIRLIDAMLKSGHLDMLSRKEIDIGLQFCAMNGHTTILQMILGVEQASFSEETFVVAAASGSVPVVQVLVSHWKEDLIAPTCDAISRALVASSENGHIAMVQYLVQSMSANVNDYVHDRVVGASLGATRPKSESKSQASQEEPNTPTVISPIQAALRTFARFAKVNDRWAHTLSPIPIAPKHQCEETIVFLINSGSDLNDLGGQNAYPIQIAAKHCPRNIVQSFISAGVDVNATKCANSALLAAAGRELSPASIVRELLAAGATVPADIEQQQELLEQALRYFKGATWDIDSLIWDHQDGRFSLAPSLEYVFNEGSGAVLFDLLNKMPQIPTTDIRWTLVLQMAAFLDIHPFVDLLLSRGTDINTRAYYYGTTLQAAARCGYVGMVQKLLDAGAEVNVLKGHWQTALRAAVAGLHAPVVVKLLEHGASTELKQDRFSQSALQLAVTSGDLDIVRVLLKRGADAVRDEDGSSHPLVVASAQGKIAIVNELISASAPINVSGKIRLYDRPLPAKNEDLIYEAIRNGDWDMDPSLKAFSKGYLNVNPIHAAIIEGHLDVVELLLAKGADIEANPWRIGTPLKFAIYYHRSDIFHLLMSHGAEATDGEALCAAVVGLGHTCVNRLCHIQWSFGRQRSRLSLY